MSFSEPQPIFGEAKVVQGERKAKQKTKFLFSFPSKELGNIQNEKPNNNFAKPSAWRVTTTPTPSCGPKKGLQPHPKALPLSRGRDATARIRSLGH